MRIQVRHKEGWVALETWSIESAEEWISNFNANIYTDKNLKKEDFEIIEPKKVEVN